MRGFRIKFRSEEIVVTPDFRSSVTIFYNSSNGYELSVAGIKGFGDDALDTFWIKSDMHIGDRNYKCRRAGLFVSELCKKIRS